MNHMAAMNQILVMRGIINQKIEDQKLVSHISKHWKGLAHQLHDDYGVMYTDKSLIRI